MIRAVLSTFATISLLAAVPRAFADDKKTEAKKEEVKKEEKKEDAKKVEKKKESKKGDDTKVVKQEEKKAAPLGPVVEVKTSEGDIKLELDEKAAPITVKNFLSYVEDKFYDGTIFHRVIDGFMIQGGGYAIEGDKRKEKPTKPPIVNEGKNGLRNDRGTIAMARLPDPNSATAQFFINLVNNDRLNHPAPDGHGYAVFGKVIEGLDVIDKIAKIKTGARYGFDTDVPQTDVKIISITVVKTNS